MSLYLAQDVPAVAALSTLEKEQDRLTRAIEKKRRQARRPVLRSIVIAMRDFEIRPAEVLAAYQRLANGHDQAKYLDPATGRTWSGRGRRPRWLKDYEAQGGSLDALLVDGTQ